jgi:hypothetical protein
VGSMSETHRFVASTALAPEASAAPIASYGRLRFRARLRSSSAESSTETAGSFAPDPNFPPADPAVCAVAPSRKSWPCRFSPQATRRSGADFVLLPNKSRYELYYNRSPALVSCEDDIGESLLARGKSVTVSGTVVTSPLDPNATGGETLRYTLKVKRVR